MRWRTLYATAGAAALLTAVLIPIQIAVFVAFSFPETVAGWFDLLRAHPVAGLVGLDLLVVVDNLLLVVIVLAVYVASYPAVEMLAFSGRCAEATTAAERAASLAAGRALLASWEGTAFQVSYVVGQVAGIVIGMVMLRTDRFGQVVPYTLIAGNVVGFGCYLPTVGCQPVAG